MSSIYKGIWPIKDVDLDFIIEFDSDETEIDGQNVKVDSIWVDLNQGLQLIQASSVSLNIISKLWTVNSNSFCPILEFLAEAAFTNPEFYQVCLESLVLKGLVPSEIHPESLVVIDHDDLRDFNVPSPPIFLEKQEQEQLDIEEEELEDMDQKDSIVITRTSIPFNKPKDGTSPRQKKTDSMETIIKSEFDDDEYFDSELTEASTVIEPAITKQKYSKLKEKKSQDDETPVIWKICIVCNKVLPGEFRFYNHFVASHPGADPAMWPARPEMSEQCEGCNKIFDNHKLYIAHTRKCGKVIREHECPICKSLFTSKQRVFKHCLVKHKQEKDSWPKQPSKRFRLADLMERNNLNCGLCKLPLNNPNGLVKHERNHADSYICVICGLPCLLLEKLIEHMDTSHAAKSTYFCKTCGFFAYDEKSYQNHVNNIHLKGSNQEYKCSECTFSTFIESTYLAHKRLHKQSLPGKTFVCDECGREFPTLNKIRNHNLPLVLKIHERVHTGEKPFQCQDCPQRFGSRSSLIKHKDNMHTSIEDMPYKCLQCNKGFTKSRKQLYLGHMKQHSGIKDHACPICSSSFTCRAYLANHFKKVHKQKLTDAVDDPLKDLSAHNNKEIDGDEEGFGDSNNQITISIVQN